MIETNDLIELPELWQIQVKYCHQVPILHNHRTNRFDCTPIYEYSSYANKCRSMATLNANTQIYSVQDVK